jgi:hypothetical protein
MPCYCYRHTETGEIFEDIRPVSRQHEPFILEDGTECPYINWWEVSKGKIGIVNKNAEVWEKDPAYVKSVNPKYVRRQDGVRERFDPNRHC